MVEDGGRWTSGLLAAAGILGAVGVGLGAASAHLGGGDLARLASMFLLLHAAAIPGLLAVSAGSRPMRHVAASLLALGAALFSGDVAVLGFTGRTLLSGLAPVGGLMLMAGWLTMAWCGVAALASRTAVR